MLSLKIIVKFFNDLKSFYPNVCFVTFLQIERVITCDWGTKNI